MSYILVRELEFKSSVDLMKAMPAITGAIHIWNRIAPDIPCQLMKAMAGHPLRIRWQFQSDSTDKLMNAAMILQRDEEYLKHTAVISSCANMQTLHDELWSTLT